MAKAAKTRTKRATKGAATQPEKAAIPSPQNVITEMATNTPAPGTNQGTTNTTTTPATPTPQPTPTANPPAATTTTTGGTGTGTGTGENEGATTDTDEAKALESKTGPPAEGDVKGPAVVGEYTVTGEFHDINDFGKVYKPGDPIKLTDKTRIADLEKKGLIKKS